MPYITKEERVELDAWIESLVEDIESAGQLNYVISKIVHGYIERRAVRYGNLNEVVGVLECAKAEFIRTVVSPYEDKKIIENGAISKLDASRKIGFPSSEKFQKILKEMHEEQVE